MPSAVRCASSSTREGTSISLRLCGAPAWTAIRPAVPPTHTRNSNNNHLQPRLDRRAFELCPPGGGSSYCMEILYSGWLAKSEGIGVSRAPKIGRQRHVCDVEDIGLVHLCSTARRKVKSRSSIVRYCNHLRMQREQLSV